MLVFPGVPELLGCWTGPHADRSTDQGSFGEAHFTVVDHQVPHAACEGLLGSNALWEERFWKEGDHTAKSNIIICYFACYYNFKKI